MVIRDPLAIRALAHPARMAVIEVLYRSRSAMTSTQLAELAGLSPSAMSYHLRSLERFGVVRRAEGGEDAREQPWERAGASLQVSPRARDSSIASRSAAGVLMAATMDRDRQALLSTLERKDRGDDSVPLDAVATYTRESLIVTVSEARALARRLREGLRRHSCGQGWGRKTGLHQRDRKSVV